MIFKQRPLLVVLLLFIIITFAFLASMRSTSSNQVKENFEGETHDVPSCSDDKSPGCYASVMDESIWDSANFNDSEDYLLKTEIVPPVCPACPSVVNQHSHDGVVGEEGQKLTGSDYKETNITNINNEENIFNENVENVSSDVSIQETRQNPNQQSFDSQNQSSQNSSNRDNQKQISDSMLKQYEKTISDLRGELSNLKQSNGNNSGNGNNGNCAPCPAPMRCPEPAFSCQKVINYKSPSAGQYLPMPVLNDFSTFKNA